MLIRKDELSSNRGRDKRIREIMLGSSRLRYRRYN